MYDNADDGRRGHTAREYLGAAWVAFCVVMTVLVFLPACVAAVLMISFHG